VKTRGARPSGREATLWRRRSFEVLTSDVVAGQRPGPEPPAAWAPHLRQLVEAARAPVEGPPWWTPGDAYFGNVETRTDPRGYRWDGMRRLGPRDRPLVFFQLTLAGWGQFLFMGLIGVVLASVVGIFWSNDGLQFVTSFIGVIVFTGLAAYDAQRLKSMALMTSAGESGSYAIVGALALYLDFVNLFLMLLRLQGGGRRR